MPGQHFERRDEKNASLHTVMDVITRELARLPAQDTRDGDETVAELRAFWGELVKLLDVEPVPELRACPVCKHVGMRAATRCGHCWAKLVPPADATSPAGA
jgi:hypothetical protein